jgi:hypothetical protein
VLGLEQAFDGAYRNRSGPLPLHTDENISTGTNTTDQPILTVILPSSELLRPSWVSTADGRRQMMTAGNVAFMLGPSTHKTFYSSDSRGNSSSHYAFFGPNTSADAANAYVKKAWLQKECAEATQLCDARSARFKNNY